MLIIITIMTLSLYIYIYIYVYIHNPSEAPECCAPSATAREMERETSTTFSPPGRAATRSASSGFKV